MVRQCELFHAMKEQFPGLTRNEKAVVNGHLAQAHSQLANHFRTAGHPVKAMIFAAKARFYGCKPRQGAASPQSFSRTIHPASKIDYDHGGNQVRGLPAR
jgi:hypothetical protein